MVDKLFPAPDEAAWHANDLYMLLVVISTPMALHTRRPMIDPWYGIAVDAEGLENLDRLWFHTRDKFHREHVIVLECSVCWPNNGVAE